MRLIRFALLGTWLLAASVTPVESAAQLSERLYTAEDLNRIDDAALKPWHLKLSVQLFDKKGQPTEKGTIEEWWKSPSVYKTVYSSPSYTSTEIRTTTGLYRSQGMASAPYLLALALQQIVHPLSAREIAEAKPDLRKENFGKAKLDCIMLSQEIRGVAYPPLGLFPTYCFDLDVDSLRIGFDFGTQMTIRNNIGVFQKRQVPVDLVTTISSVNAMTAHVEDLRSANFEDTEFAQTSDFEKVDDSPASVGSGVMAGRLLSQPAPIYPTAAKMRHATGTVLLRARIGRDGQIHLLRIASAPDPDLAIAAIAAVRQWTYKPYTLNGTTVEVDTQITVNFRMN